MNPPAGRQDFSTASQMLAAPMILISIALLLVYCFSALSLGALLLRVVAGRRGLGEGHTPAARAGTAFLLGSGVLANVWLLISLIPGGWFTPLAVGGVVAACLIGGVRSGGRELVGFIGQFGAAVRRLLRGKSWAWKIIGLGTLVLVLLYGLTSALPPKGDAAAFYMALPKLTAHLHRLIPLPTYETFTQIGLHGEMHFAALMALGSDQAATMFVFATCLAMVVMLLETARRAGLGAKGRWVVLVMVFTSTAVTRVIPGGKVDLFGSAMALAALYWVLEAGGLRRKLPLALAGVFAGLAVVGKLSLAVTVVPMVGALALWRVGFAPRGDRRGVLGGMVLCCLLLVGFGALAVLPSVLKNGLLFGEPLAPFVTKAQSFLQQADLWRGAEATRHLLSIYPMALFLGQFQGMYGVMSVLIPAFFPLLLLRGRVSWVRSTLVQLTAVSVAGVALWAVFQPGVFALRYFLPPLLLLTLPAARGAEYAFAAGRSRSLRIGVLICLVMAMAATFNRPKGHVGDAMKYVLGRATQADVGDFPARMGETVNSHATAGQRVFLGTPFCYFLRADLLASAGGQDDFAALRALKTDEQRWEYLYREGFRYVMVSPQGGSISPDGANCVIHRGGATLDSTRLPAWLEITPIFREGPKHHSSPILYAVYVLKRKSEEKLKAES